MKAIAPLAIVVLLCGAAVYSFRGEDEGPQPEAVADSHPYEVGLPEIVEVMKAVPPAPKSKKEIPPKRRLYFPDGSYLPALNNTRNAQPVVFRNRAFSPVIGKEKDSSGREWYKHEDGSYSTTIMGFRKDLGRMDAITQVAHPIETRPLLLDEQVGPGGVAPPPLKKRPQPSAASKAGSAAVPVTGTATKTRKN